MKSLSIFRVCQDQHGATVVEFALAFPVIAALIFGGMEMARHSYMQSVLFGEVQKAGRDGTLETIGGRQASIDDQVKYVTRQLAKHGVPTVKRRFHKTFARSKQPEKFTDSNGNNQRDAGECFEDVNANGTFDNVSGKTGTGGADDIVVYTFSLTYDRAFPVTILGWGKTNTVTATTVLRNQPFSNQASEAAATVVCT